MKAFKKVMSYIPLISNGTKLTISVCLSLFALTMAFHYFTIPAWICFIAMLFSTVGDIALNCKPHDLRPHSYLYVGAGFFMLAHITYAIAFGIMIRNSEKSYFNIGTLLAIVFIIIICIGSIICVINAKEKMPKKMIIVFGIYVIIIGINFITISSYSWIYGSIATIGALSFLISDLIIGIENVFKIKSDILRKLVWIFYPIGQFILLACNK